MSYSEIVIQIQISEQLILQFIINKNQKLTKYLKIAKITQINHKTFNKTSLFQMVDKYVDGNGRQTQTDL